METPYLQVVAWYISPVASLAWWVPLLWGIEKVALDRLAALSLTTCLWPYLGKVSKSCQLSLGDRKGIQRDFTLGHLSVCQIEVLGTLFLWIGLVWLQRWIYRCFPQWLLSRSSAHSWHTAGTQNIASHSQQLFQHGIKSFRFGCQFLCEYSRGQLDMRSKFSL